MSTEYFGYVEPVAGDEGGLRKGPPKPTAARRALAINLKHLRLNYQHGFLKGLTPEQLAEGLNQALSAKTIRRLEDQFNDTSPNLDTIDILAHFFGAQSWDLIQPQASASIVSGRERHTPHQPAHSATAKKRSALTHKKEKSAKS